MRKIWLVTIVFLAALANAHNAAAFSRDQSANQNSDGSPKFADPDEQMPDFMATPSNSGIGDKGFAFSSPTANATAPTISNNDNGAKAFDQAFSHQQNKE